MAQIDWPAKYYLDIKEIDNQHKKLIDTINALDKAISEKRVETELKEIFSRIAEYTDVHFATEEKYFKEFKYPEADMHILAHREFAKQIEEYKAVMLERPYTVAMKLVIFLDGWWIDHVSIVDKRYSQFFHEHGLH